MIVHVPLSLLALVKTLNLSHQQLVFRRNLLFRAKRVEKVDDNEILYIQFVCVEKFRQMHYQS